MSASGSMHVLMTADTIGGVWTYACELIAALGPLGIDVTLATMGAPLSPAQAHAAAAVPNLDVHESSYALEWMPEPWRDVDAAGDWLLELAQRTRARLVHLNGYAHAALPFDAPIVSVAHACVCSWFRAVRGVDAGPEWSEYRRRCALGLTSADAVVAPTAAILRAILSALGSDVQGHVIANGRASARCRPASKEPFVLGAGELWDEAKGLATLDACAARVRWPIRVTGPTTAPAGTARVAARRLELVGELAADEVAAWMGRASVFAHPARYEPFGLLVVEAALSGCALVLGDLDTLREVWGHDAVYVPPGDPEALAFALETMIDDPLRRGALATSARVRARTLTPARMATAYHALYEQLTRTRQEEVCA